MKKAFTIIELIMVIAIIGILMTLVNVVAKGSIQQAHKHRAEALCRLVEQGLATYYAHRGEWPVDVETMSAVQNEEGANGENDEDLRVLTPNDVRKSVRELVLQATKGNPPMDISGLFVSRNPGEKNDRGYGLDFMDAIHGTPESPTKMSVSEMYFGYPEPSHGYFRRFKIVYSVPTDQMKVSQQ